MPDLARSFPVFDRKTQFPAGPYAKGRVDGIRIAVPGSSLRESALSRFEYLPQGEAIDLSGNVDLEIAWFRGFDAKPGFPDRDWKIADTGQFRTQDATLQGPIFWRVMTFPMPPSAEEAHRSRGIKAIAGYAGFSAWLGLTYFLPVPGFIIALWLAGHVLNKLAAGRPFRDAEQFSTAHFVCPVLKDRA